MNSSSPSISPMAPGNTTDPFASSIEADTVQARRDLAIVFALISLAIPFFVVSLRVFHPRRIAKYSAHDYLLFLAMFFALVATAGMITELRFGFKPADVLVEKNALIATIATSMEFFTSVTLGRLSAMLFALQVFGDKIRNPCRETIINRVLIFVVLVGASVQGLAAVITTVAACSPVPSVWTPELFERDCRFYNNIQVVHAATDFWKNSLIIILFTVLYMRRGFGNRLRYLKYVMLTVGAITCFLGLARTIFLRRHANEIFPPLRLLTPKILLVLEMDFVLTSVGLLTISTAILPRSDSQSNVELGSRPPFQSETYYGEFRGKAVPRSLNDEYQAKGKVTATTWDALPDLEFQSDNPYNEMKSKKQRPKMLDQGTMTTPTLDKFPSCPTKTLLRRLSILSPRWPMPKLSPNIIRTMKPPSSSKSQSFPRNAADPSIPPLPFGQSTDSPLETPAYNKEMLSQDSRRLSVASYASSSDLSSGPFSDDEDDNDDEVIVVKPETTRRQSVADHTRHASVAITGRRSSWGIHEVEIGPRSTSQ